MVGIYIYQRWAIITFTMPIIIIYDVKLIINSILRSIYTCYDKLFLIALITGSVLCAG